MTAPKCIACLGGPVEPDSLYAGTKRGLCDACFDDWCDRANRDTYFAEWLTNRVRTFERRRGRRGKR